MAGLRMLLLLLYLIPVLFFLCEANRVILVGGKPNAWTIPSSSNDTLNLWAERNRFKVGDLLIWKYDPVTDSVLQVRKEDYESCKRSNPLNEHRNGHTIIELDHSGPFYFVSGAQGNCERGQKLIVVVLSEDHWFKNNISSTATPAPSLPPKNEVHGLKGGAFFDVILATGLGLMVVC